MTAFAEQFSLPDELQDTAAKDKDARPQVAIAVKEAPVYAPSVASNELQISLSSVSQHICCPLCSNLIASSLVLSCGHQYCGSCLFDFLGNKPSCPNCQVPLRAIPMRCIALDGIVEAFLTSLPEEEVAAYKVRQEEGKSAANKVNKMFWWLQPSAMPGMPPAGGSNGYSGGPGQSGMPQHMGGGGGMMGSKQGSYGGAPMPQQLPNGGMMTSGMMGGNNNNNQYNNNHHTKGMPSHNGSMRRSSQSGAPPQHQHQQGFPPRQGRSNSFSAGGAGPGPISGPLLPPQVAASIAAAGFTGPTMPMGSGNTAADFEANYLSIAQKFGMEGVALPLVYQQLQQQQLHHQQQLQQQEQFRGLLHACASELQAVDLASPPNHGAYADPAQLQQLLQGLYFA